MKLTDLVRNIFRKNKTSKDDEYSKYKQNASDSYIDSDDLEDIISDTINKIIYKRVLSISDGVAGGLPASCKIFSNNSRANAYIAYEYGGAFTANVDLPVNHPSIIKIMLDMAKYAKQEENQLANNYENYEDQLEIDVDDYYDPMSSRQYYDDPKFQYIRNRIEFTNRVCKKIASILGTRIKATDLNIDYKGIRFKMQKYKVYSTSADIAFGSLSSYDLSSEFELTYPNIVFELQYITEYNK